VLAKLCLAVAAAAIASSALVLPAQAQPVRIGVLNDQSGQYSDQTGPGSVVAARMAVEDFGPTVLGRPIEVLAGDHQNKPDVGAAVARQWFDRDGVDVVVDVPTSSVALAVNEVAKASGRVAIFSGAAAAELTGAACGPYSMQWTYDTYALAAGTGAAVTQGGGKTWFLLTADYSFGAAMQRDLTAIVLANGGEIVGSVKHPFGTADFSSYLVQARASGAQVVGLLNAGKDTTNAVKQAAEFGLGAGGGAGGQTLAGMVVTVVDIHALGLPTAQGLEFTESFYWDQDDATRAWSRRFFERHRRQATMMQAGAYSATLHYLRAVKEAGTTDAAAVTAAMRRLPVEDMMTHGARIREDGRLMRDFTLFRAKAPAESKGEWDLYTRVSTIPAAQAARPLEGSACPLLKH